MARWPEPGRAKTRMIPLLGPAGAASLHEILVQSTLRCAREFRATAHVDLEVRCTGAAEVRMAEHFGADIRYRDQGTGDLGARLAVATSEALTAGAGRVVVIGTDCPALTPHHLAAALDALTSHDVVIGPALDGGYYLIGLIGTARWNRRLFEGVPWGTDTVLERTQEACRQIGLSTLLLDPLPDIDVPHDLRHLPPESRRALAAADPTVAIHLGEA